MKVIVEQFVLSLSESGLMTRDEIDTFLNRLPAEQRPQTAEAFARALVEHETLTKYQVQAVYHGNTKGLVLGNYVVLDKIGQGGMGQVYKAMHRRMKRIVVLKVVLPKSATSKEAMQRFQREVEALAKLSHPNIVTAHDADEAGGVCFLVMEYVEGQDLAKLVRQDGPLPVKKTVDYVIQAARGLEYAHRREVIHRDIKPSNLVLDVHGTVKILDLGLAKLQQDVGIDVSSASASLTQTGQVVGTIDYLSPEQSLDSRRVDGRSDIYSLGCTLFFLLMGRPIFGGDTVARKILAHREDAVPSLCLLRRDVPEQLDRAFRRMVAKRPEYRFQSMGEAIAELEACGSALAPVAPEAETVTFVGPQRSTISGQDDSTNILYWTGKATSLVRTFGSTRWQTWLVVANVVVLLAIIVWFFFAGGSRDTNDSPPGPIAAGEGLAPPVTSPQDAVASGVSTAGEGETTIPQQATASFPQPVPTVPPKPGDQPEQTVLVENSGSRQQAPVPPVPSQPPQLTAPSTQAPSVVGETVAPVPKEMLHQPTPSVETTAPPAEGVSAKEGLKPETPEPPAKPVPPASAAPEPSQAAAIPAKPEPTPTKPGKPTPIPQWSREELFAALTQFGLAVEFKFVGGDGKPPKQLVPIMEEFRLTLRSTLEQMVSVKTVGLHIGDDTSQAVMEVVITPRVDQGLVFDASAKLKSKTGQEWIELWSKPQAELVRFMPQGQPAQIKRVWTEKIREYFQDFRTQRMKLVKWDGAQE